MSSGSEYKGPTPDELQARAAAVRAELKELEAKAGLTRRPNAELIEQQQQVGWGEAREQRICKALGLFFRSTRKFNRLALTVMFNYHVVYWIKS